MAPYVSVVIPVFNEEDNINHLWSRLSSVLADYCQRQNRQWEVVFTDDGSQDGSLVLLREIARQEPKVSVVEFNRNYGQHAAILGAFAASQGEIIITIDADLQNPPEEIPRLISKIEEGFDIVGGFRQERTSHDSLFRTLPSKIINIITRKVTGVKLHDYGCMLRAYRREIIDIILRCNDYSCFIPTLANSFAKNIAEIPVQHAKRASGTSKYGFWRLVNLQFDLLTGFSIIPLQMLSVIGVITSTLGISTGIIVIVGRTIYPYIKNWGVLTIIATLLFFTGSQFMAFGLLGEYIGRIYQEVRSRPRYFVRNVYKAKEIED